MDETRTSKALGFSAGHDRRAWIWLLLVLVVVTAIRIRLLDMPLERDEGEFAYGGQLMLHGVSIYKGAYNDALKLPGTCAAYALAMAAFGQTPAAIHLAALLVTLATAFFVFLLGRRLGSPGSGVVAAGVYALLSISPPSFGFAAHATHFVLLPAVAGIYLLVRVDEATKIARFFFAGLLFGVAILMKQTGAMFGIFAALWTINREWATLKKSGRRLTLRLSGLALGGLLPFLITCGVIVLSGDWARFWFWTSKYAGAHASVISWVKSLETARDEALILFAAAPALWTLALAGLVLLFCASSLRPARLFIVGFTLCSLAAVYPGWRGHYFIQLFPALGLLAGAAFHGVWSAWERWNIPNPQTLLIPLFLVILVTPLFQWRSIYFTLTPAAATRAVYPGSPFPETVEIGRYFAAHCPPDGRIAVLGSEPEIYFYSGRRAATGYISAFPLMEPQPYALAMQKEMISEIESAAPDYVAFVHVPVSWLQYSDSNPFVFFWFQQYQRSHLKLVGLVEMPPAGPPTYHWFDGDVTNVQTTAELWISIFKKR